MKIKLLMIAFIAKYRALAASLFFLFSVLFLLNAPAAANAGGAVENGFIQQSKEQKQQLSDQWGIELVSMRSTAAGHMVDFRYRVLDADKAAPLFKRQTKPYLIHQASGKVLGVPNTAKIGSLRNSNTPQNGRTYWMFFGNHHRLVQKGDRVTVAIGEFRARDIEVE
ncbi:MAG: hypothetical protein OQK69_06505 [Gammaproteobacteria bacterium]|nr:hypothetical protein [Gammaproteobacteria bacterium]